MAFKTAVSRLLVQAGKDTPYGYGNVFHLGTQVLVHPFDKDTSISHLIANVMFRADAAPDGTRRSVAPTTNAEDSEVIYSELIFPECISYGSTGSPRYMTNKTEVASGAEARNARWEYPKHKFNILMKEIPSDEIAKVMNIWHVCSGPHAGFLFLDPLDHTSSNTVDVLAGSDVTPTDQLVGTAVGSVATYEIYKYYKSGLREKRRRILYPQIDTLRIAVDGYECFNWDYSFSTHKLTFILARGPSAATLTKTGENITGHTWTGLQVGDLIYIDGWSNPAYNFPEGGNPVRVRSVTSSQLVLEKYDGSDYGLANFSAEAVTFKSALPPSGAEITSGYYFHVPCRFGDDDDMESEITSGMRESAFATFDSITLVEIAE